MSSEITPTRRTILAAGLALSTVPLRAQSATPHFTVEQFGAVGDGRTNDTLAFQAAATAMNRAGGGTLSLRAGAVYVIGRQLPNPDIDRNSYSFQPSDILKFVRCGRDVVVEGNGATLRAPAGYLYGTFGADGRPTRNAMPFYGKGMAACYHAMIAAEGCTGNIFIHNLVLDGNAPAARLGGGWGDTGWQLPGSGLWFRNNTGRWRVSDVRSFHHPLDGILVDEPGLATTPPSGSGTDSCDFYENGRQAMSIVGGVGLVFRQSKFRRTRRGVPMQSAPGAGVDLEAEGGKTVRDIAFEGCELSDNVGPALLQVGAVSHVTLSDCRLLGTTTWAFYPSGGRFFNFVRTRIAGAVVNLSGGAAGERFEDCLLTNDPAFGVQGRAPFSPEGQLIPDGIRGVRFIRGEIRHAVAQASFNANFDQMSLTGVTIRALRGAVAIYGRFSGRTRFVEAGGQILATPGALATPRSSGGADAPWTLTRGGTTRPFPATPPKKGI